MGYLKSHCRPVIQNFLPYPRSCRLRTRDPSEGCGSCDGLRWPLHEAGYGFESGIQHATLGFYPGCHASEAEGSAHGEATVHLQDGLENLQPVYQGKAKGQGQYTLMVIYYKHIKSSEYYKIVYYIMHIKF